MSEIPDLNQKSKGPKMALVKIVEVWEQKFPAEQERKWMNPQGREVTFPAVAEHVGLVAVVEDVSPTSVRAQVRLPDYFKQTKDIPVGTVVQMEIPDWPDSPLRSRNVTRVIPPSSK